VEKRVTKTRSKILVVDDDPVIRDIIAQYVLSIGYEVGQADDGINALEKLHSDDFDIILTDVNMPRMGGLELIKEVKKIDSYIPVLALTAYPSLSVGIQALKEGASDFLPKPFQLEELKFYIKRLLNEGELLREKESLSKEASRKQQIERINEELHKKLREITLLHSISETIDSISDNEILLKKTVEMVSKIVQVEVIAVGIIAKQKFHIKHSRGLQNYDSIVITNTILETAILQKKYVIDEAGSQCFFPTIQLKSCLLAIPMMIKDEVFGLLVIINKINGKQFTNEEINLLSTLINKTCMKIENNSLYDKMYGHFMDSLYSLVATIEARDSYTKEHSLRVTQYAMEIADVLGLDNTSKDIIKLAGYLHDIGKIGVRDSVLLKKGRLTKDEYEEVKRHVIIGDEILKPLKFLPIERSIVKHHHEWFDGSGYPYGLKGRDIPLFARMTIVADTYDALTTTRPYRTERSHDEAIAEIKAFSGRQFDPEMVEAFLLTPTCIKKERYILETVYPSFTF
jgi:putative nucleotidyltransferase with HDIG domain